MIGILLQMKNSNKNEASIQESIEEEQDLKQKEDEKEEITKNLIDERRHSPQDQMMKTAPAQRNIPEE